MSKRMWHFCMSCCGIFNCTQHADRIFNKDFVQWNYSSQNMRFDITHSANIVDYLLLKNDAWARLLDYYNSL